MSLEQELEERINNECVGKGYDGWGGLYCLCSDIERALAEKTGISTRQFNFNYGRRNAYVNFFYRDLILFTITISKQKNNHYYQRYEDGCLDRHFYNIKKVNFEFQNRTIEEIIKGIDEYYIKKEQYDKDINTRCVAMISTLKDLGWFREDLLALEKYIKEHKYNSDNILNTLEERKENN